MDTDQSLQVAFPSRHFSILKKLFGMASAGTKIYYVYGNRDALVDLFRDKALGNVHFTKNLFLDLDGKKAWFTNGDFLESPLFGKKWVQGLGTGVLSALARSIRFKNNLFKAIGINNTTPRLHPVGSSEDSFLSRQDIRETAVRLAVGRGCEYLICGAPHEPSKLWLETRAGKCQYLSAGDWVHYLTTLEYNFKRWKPYRYSEDKLSPFFADEELKAMNAEELLAKNLKSGTAVT